MTVLLLAQAAATWALVGLIWTMQLVHYPLFAAVGRAGYPAWQRAHMARITPLVGPLMAVEALAAVGVALAAFGGVRPALAAPAVVGLVLLAAIWLSTALVQAPLHGRLAAGFDPVLHRRLVGSNWMRTAAWTARGIVVLVMAGVAVG